MKQETLIKLGAVVIIFNILSLVLTQFFPQVNLNFLMVTAFAFGLWILWQRPFEDAGYSTQYDTNIASTIALIFVLYTAWEILSPILAEQEEADGPCSTMTVEKRCYTFTAANCKTIWTHYEKECGEEIRKTIYEKTPGALVGPATKRCIYQRLDKSFQSTRRTTEEPICLQHFQKMDSQ